MYDYTPLGDRALVKPLIQPEKSLGGVHLPDSVREKAQEGTIIACGEGRVLESGMLVPMRVKAGDRVLYSKYAGQECTLNGETHLILTSRDMLAVVSKSE